MKVASFTVRATLAQSERWKRAADLEGYLSVGAWAAPALDSYLKARLRAGRPLPLAWRHGRFRARLDDGTEPELRGWQAPPFALFRGSAAGPGYPGSKLYALVYDRRIVATFRFARQCRELAAELAPILLRSEPFRDPAAIVERHSREAV